MPPLTWRNVDAPDLSRASSILNDAAANWQTGLSGTADNLTGIRDRQRRDRTAAIVPMLAGIQNSSQVDGVLAQISSQIDPRDLTPEGQAAIMAQRGVTADIDSVGAVTDATRGGENRSQTSFDRNITREDQLAGLTPELLRMQQDAYNNPATDGVTATGNLLREFEGFSDTSYYDVNADRAGYGSDTVTSEDGTVSRVRPDTRVSRADAERDLNRRLREEFIPGVIGSIGQEAYDSLNTNQQAVLGSLAYNYGSLPNSVVAAVRTGDQNAIAQSIVGLRGHNDGVNADRRDREAQLFLGGGDMAVPNIAGLLPTTGNMLRPEDVMGLVDDLYGDRRTATNDRQADLDAEATRTAAQQVILDEQLAADAAKDVGKLDSTAQQWVVDNRETWGMGDAGLNSVIDGINQDSSISEDMRARRIAAATNAYTNDAGRFDSEGSYVNVAQERSFQVAETEAQAAVDHAGIVMGDNVRAAIQGNGDSTADSGSIYANIQATLGEEAAANASSPEQLTSTVDSVFDHFEGAIPKSLIYARLQDAVTGYGDWNPLTEEAFFLDEDKLIESLAPLADLGDFKTARNELLTQANAQEDITNLRNAYNANNEAIAFERARKGAEGGSQRVDEMLAENEELLKGMRDLTRTEEDIPAKRADRAAAAAEGLTQTTQGPASGPAPAAPQAAAPATVDSVINSAVAGIGSPLNVDAVTQEVVTTVSTWEFPDTPVGQEANDYYKSPAAIRFFINNPAEMEAAEADPVGYYAWLKEIGMLVPEE